MKVIRLISLACGLLLLWHFWVVVTGFPHYILPGPVPVFYAIINHWSVLTGTPPDYLNRNNPRYIAWHCPGGDHCAHYDSFAAAETMDVTCPGNKSSHSGFCSRTNSRSLVWLWYGIQGCYGGVNYLFSCDLFLLLRDAAHRATPAGVGQNNGWSANFNNALYRCTVSDAVVCLRAASCNSRGTNWCGGWGVGWFQCWTRFLYASCQCANAD